MHGRSDGELLDRVAALVAARNRLDAELTAAVRVADARPACERDGLRSRKQVAVIAPSPPPTAAPRPACGWPRSTRRSRRWPARSPCDAHHLLDRALGGPTALGNLALLCERHHTTVHHGFRVDRRSGR